ncbi:MAG: ComEC/Rec2 family competence protein [Ferruginibacter sp.]
MYYPNPVQIWKVAPFIRLLLPLTAGIILHWYLQIPLMLIVAATAVFFLGWLMFYFISLSSKYRWQFIQGLLLNLLLVSLGCLLTWQKDIRHSKEWFGNYYHDSDYIAIRINEPLVEKAKSYKADGIVEWLNRNDSIISCNGKVLLYFSKDSATQQLHYGDVILISKNLQRIKNSGNPGAFNYERYASFQQIFHNVYLKENDWLPLKISQVNPLKQFIFNARDYVLSILQKNVGGNKDELGIAQALLIGYTNDLDKDLVQAYSNTGVVHIIAISGMHLGLIYVLLVWIFGKLPFINRSKIVQVLLILACLWMFSLLTGASASVVRAAVMFTFITIGTSLEKRSSIYNSLAASAFVMLCYNPYFIWDVGFQLSYLAVVGIIIFQKPVYNWFYIKNKWLDKVWKLAAISIAAQVLTFPVCIYYFHQFPNLFLLTNIIAVPLSSIILYAEIALVCFSGVPGVGFLLGKLVGMLVGAMNAFILWMNDFPYAVWDKISSSVLSTWLLYAVVISIAAWLINKNRGILKFSLLSLLAFVVVYAHDKWQIKNQQKLIVYNVSQHQAIDFVSGNKYRFIGDSILLEDGMLQNFNLKPGRVALQLTQPTMELNGLFPTNSFYQFHHTKILLVNGPLYYEPAAQKIDLDIIIISHGPKISIAQLAAVFNCRQYVFDASNSLWKIDKWRKDCEELHLRSHSIPSDGAFVLNIE